MRSCATRRASSRTCAPAGERERRARERDAPRRGKQGDELLITQKALDRAGAQAAELRSELAETQTALDRARLEAQELDTLRAKLSDAELALRESDQAHEQTQKRMERVEGRLADAQGAAFASERAAEQLRMAQERMREALRPLDEDEPDPTRPSRAGSSGTAARTP